MSKSSSPSESASPFKIGPDRRLIVTLGTIVTLLGGCIFGTWNAAIAFNKMDASIDALSRRMDYIHADTTKQLQATREELALKVGQAWLVEEQFRWSSQLKWEFRNSTFTIPDPKEFRARN